MCGFYIFAAAVFSCFAELHAVTSHHSFGIDKKFDDDFDSYDQNGHNYDEPYQPETYEDMSEDDDLRRDLFEEYSEDIENEESFDERHDDEDGFDDSYVRDYIRMMRDGENGNDEEFDEEEGDTVQADSKDNSAFDAIATTNANVRGLVEGDIMTDSAGDQAQDVSSRDAVLKDEEKWPKTGHFAYVPYFLETKSGERISVFGKMSVAAAVRKLRSVSCVRLIPKTTESKYIRIIHGSGCWSSVGYKARVQDLSLQQFGCDSQKIAIHEFMHALGFWHEQSRPDRDDYIKINWDNIKDGKAHNFRKASADDVSYYGGTYDRKSIMHYGSYAFSKNLGRTIVWKKKGWLGVTLNTGGDRLTSIDIKQLNNVYNCDATCNGVEVPKSKIRSTLSRTILRSDVSTKMRSLYVSFLFQKRTSTVSDAVYKMLYCQYQNYHFTVDVYNPVTGYDKHAVTGYYIHFFRFCAKNIVVAWRRKSSVPSVSSINSATNAVKNKLTGSGCDPRKNVATAYNIIKRYGGKMAHVVKYNNHLSMSSNSRNTRKFRYQCKCTRTWLGTKCSYEEIVLSF